MMLHCLYECKAVDGASLRFSRQAEIIARLLTLLCIVFFPDMRNEHIRILYAVLKSDEG